jgi:putative transposase
MAGQIRTQQDLSAMMRMMMKAVMERALDAELDVHLGRRKVAVSSDATASAATPVGATYQADEPSGQRSGNRRNGHSKKTVQGDMDELTLETPRDRHGTFEPLLVPKYQRRIPGFDEKIIALFAKRLSTRDVQEILEDLNGVEVSASLISDATSAIDEEVTAWRSRPLDPVWPIVHSDGLVVHLVRAAMRYATDKDCHLVAADLRKMGLSPWP